MSINSVNPMTLSDDAFAFYRTIGDEHIDRIAATYLNLVDQHSIMAALESISNNSSEIVLTNVKLDEHKWKGTEEEKEKLRNEAISHLSGYFNDSLPEGKMFEFSPEETIILQKASAFFCDNMTECTVALAVRSLLKQYSAFNSTNVLIYTQLLPKYPHRRIISTMQFVMDVMDVDAFGPNGRAIIAIQKLRFVHSMVRARIMYMSENPEIPFNWNQKEWGYPINQQDMVFAIHTFSIEVLKGLLASGEKISEETIQNYYHAWHIIGRALGIDPAINPSNYEIGNSVQQRIYDKEFTSNNPNAHKLVEPLIRFLEEVLPMANRASVLGIVKLFNDEKDYEPIFKGILNLDLNHVNNFYTSLYKSGDKLLHFILKIKYWFFPKSERSHFFTSLAQKQHHFFESIMNIEKTWTSNHFRIADGFGTQAAQLDQIRLSIEIPAWKRILNKYLPTSVLKILGIYINIKDQIKQ